MKVALGLLSLPIVTGALVWLFLRGVARDHGQGATRGLRLVAGNLLVLLFFGSIVFAAGEAYYRFLYDTTDSFSYSRTSQRWFRRYFRPNAAGFRDNVEYADRIRPGRRRITFLGDSFTVGHGIKNVENRFANRIRRAHPEWEVHALAELGYDTGDELRTLRTEINHGYQLDQVVLVYCLNDVVDILPEWGRILERIRSDQTVNAYWLRQRSYFVDTVYHRLKVWREPDMRNYFQVVRDAYRGPVWEQQQQRLRSLREAAEAAGGELRVVTFPFLHALGPNYEYQPVHDALNRLWREWEVPHLDLLTIYRSIPPGQLVVNSLDAHPNEYAHGLAAEAIGRFLEQAMSDRTSVRPPAGRTRPVKEGGR
jgi:hypothetical protein